MVFLSTDDRSRLYDRPSHPQCQICGSYFRSKQELKKHVKAHGTEPPFNCGHCGKFPAWNEKELREHSNIEHPFSGMFKVVEGMKAEVPNRITDLNCIEKPVLPEVIDLTQDDEIENQTLSSEPGPSCKSDSDDIPPSPVSYYTSEEDVDNGKSSHAYDKGKRKNNEDKSKGKCKKSKHYKRIVNPPDTDSDEDICEERKYTGSFNNRIIKKNKSYYSSDDDG